MKHRTKDVEYFDEIEGCQEISSLATRWESPLSLHLSLLNSSIWTVKEARWWGQGWLETYIFFHNTPTL
jgi:hypothetical protein